MIVVSPWSKGGWVNSQVFDHTSLIQFIETRFGPEHPGLKEHNITKWRRAVTGDLTSAFDFASPNDGKVALPSTVAYLPPDNQRHPDYTPAPPVDQAMPIQESGLRPARALPYELNVRGLADLSNHTFNIHFGNSGKATAVYHVRSGSSQSGPQSGPWTYTVEPNAKISDQWTFAANGQSTYDLSVYGPNGFLRAFKGSASGSDKANLDITSLYDTVHPGISLEIVNRGADCQVSIADVYTKEKLTHNLKTGETLTKHWPLKKSYGWYDFIVAVNSDSTFQQRIAGHVETGDDSMSDPAIGATLVV